MSNLLRFVSSNGLQYYDLHNFLFGTVTACASLGFIGGERRTGWRKSSLIERFAHCVLLRRLADRKVEKFEKNIKKRGAVAETATKKGNSYPVGPIVLGFFIFVVIGSSLFQIIRTATSGGMA
ncbi:hypothetical protein U1Q18_000060 [Sarracenia purpurea var. burkii]